MKRSRRDNTSFITEGSIASAILTLAVPMLVTGVLQNVQSLIDLFWVGRLGSTAVASVAVAGTLLMLLSPMMMGLAIGTIALVSRAVGGGRLEEAESAAGQALFMAIAAGGFSGVVGWLLAEPLIRLFGTAPEVAQEGIRYLRISFAGSFTVYLLFTGNAVLQGSGDVHTPMYLMAAANFLNIVLDPLLIFGWKPFPRLGVSGAATATVISQAIACVGCVYALLGGRSYVRARLGSWRPNMEVAWRILRIGMPGSGQMLSRSLMSLVLMRIVASCGTAAVAAYGIGLRFHFIVLLPAFALGGAGATMVGQNLGAAQPQRARRAAWMATFMDMGFMAIAVAVFVIAAPSLIGIFNRTPEVVAIGTRYLRIVSPFYLATALGIVLGRSLSGAGDTVTPMLITILTLWGGQVPAAIFLSRVMNPPTDGVWWAMAFAFVAQGLLTAYWFERGTWARKKV